MSHEVERSKVIAATPQRLWKALSDAKEAAKWLPHAHGVRMLDGAKPAPGARRHVTLDVEGKTVASVQEITEFEPDVRFGWRHVSDTVDGEPFDLLSEAGLHFTLALANGKTKVTVVARWQARGFKARLAAPVIKRVVTDQAQQALDNLAKHVKG